MTRLVVIGGASLDLLHFAGRTETSAGGAGLYTALAAHRAGARVTMVGPRPDPVPPELAEPMRRLDWRGPIVPPEELPSFEIEHLSEGATEMLDLHWRAEGDLSVAGLPADLPDGLVYCIALADPARQVEFLEHFKSLGRRIATGTFTNAIEIDRAAVLAAIELTDIFFCNQREAIEIFGSLEAAHTASGRLLFVTRGRLGVRVLQGDHATDLPASAVCELDPTGAGDTFCGTTLAWLERGLHPVLAAERGVAAASDMVTGVGPERLLEAPVPPVRSGTRVRLDAARIADVAAVLATAGEVEPFEFLGGHFPEAGDPAALDLFFASTLQQFGFWIDDGDRYVRPVIARLGGVPLKGSDYLAACYRRWLEQAPEELTPRGQADLTHRRLHRRLADDDGDCPLPDLEQRLALARRYGRDLIALDLAPATLVERANAGARPLEELLRSLDRIGGYQEDPLRKKSALLAIILRQRPEAFLRQAEQDDAPPIVDYHVQRSCLRMGLVRIPDPTLTARLERRELLTGAEESEIRRACFEAVDALQVASGRSMGAVDWFLFQNRSRCPEMTEPECASCAVDRVCAHAKELFQPVLRTTFY